MRNDDNPGVEHGTGPQDFRSMSIILSRNDFLNPDNYLLRPLQDRYESCEEYLNALFRIYREDMISTLRDGVARYKIIAGMESDDALRRYKVVSVRRVGGLQLIDWDFCTLIRTLIIDQTDDIDFEGGSTMVCMSGDNFVKDFQCGLLEDKMNLNGPTINVEFFEDHNEAINPNGSYKLAFSHMVEFQKHKHTLQRLQALTPYLPKPMELYMVRGCHEVMKPAYIRLADEPVSTGYQQMMRAYEAREKSASDKQNLTSNSGVKEARRGRIYLDGEDIQMDELIEKYQPDHLDEDQRLAVCQALSQEFSFVSGPPATGKTNMVATEIVRILLQNHNRFHEPRPILLTAFSNPELDALLEAVHKMIKREIENGRLKYGGPIACRLGKGTQSQYIKDERLQLYHFIDDNRSVPTSVQRMVAAAASAKHRLLRQIAAHAFIMQNKSTMFRMETFHGEMKQEHLGQLRSYSQSLSEHQTKITADEAFGCWLLGVQRNANGILEISTRDYVPATEPTQNEQAHNRGYMNGYETERTWDVVQSGGAALRRSNDLVCTFSPVEDTPHYLEDWFCCEMWKELSRLQHIILAERAMSEETADEVADIMALSLQERWSLYAFWRYRAATRCAEEMDQMKNDLLAAKAQYNDLFALKTSELLRHTLILGVTSTGMAKFHSIVDKVACPIIIIDAAQRSFESHLATCLLNQSVEHAVLLGTYPFMQFTTCVNELAALGSHITMFERLIRTGFPATKLRTQYNINPTITNTILVPHIFSEPLHVQNPEPIPPLKGLEHPVFFWDHDHTGEHVENMEAKMLVNLADYILQQGQFTMKDIWLLGFSLDIFKEAEGKFVVDEKSDQLKAVEDMCHDNDGVRGKRNKVIIVSLYFPDSEVDGFQDLAMKHILWLTRSEHVLYMVGNSAELSKVSKIWQNVCSSLQEKGLISKTPPIPTLNNQFEKSTDSGQLECDKTVEQERQVPSSQLLSSPGKKKTKWIQLSCGHRANTDNLNSVCEADCGAPLKCGHKCGRSCGECKTSDQKSQPNSAVGAKHCCKTVCGKLMSCGHFCIGICGEECVCKLTCLVKCDHMTCGLSEESKVEFERTCEEVCVLCTELCSNSCSHRKCMRRCSEICGVDACDEPCEKDLLCGHPCSGVCSEICPELCIVCDKEECLSLSGLKLDDRIEQAPRIIQLPCGHRHAVQQLDAIVTEYMKNGDLPVCPEKYCGQSLALVRRYQKEFKTYVLKRHDKLVTKLSNSTHLTTSALRGLSNYRYRSRPNLVSDTLRRTLEVTNSQMEIDRAFVVFHAKCIHSLLLVNDWVNAPFRRVPPTLLPRKFELVRRCGVKSKTLTENIKLNFHGLVEWFLLSASYKRLGAILYFRTRLEKIVLYMKLCELFQGDTDLCVQNLQKCMKTFKELQTAVNCGMAKHQQEMCEEWCHLVDTLITRPGFVMPDISIVAEFSNSNAEKKEKSRRRL